MKTSVYHKHWKPFACHWLLWGSKAISFAHLRVWKVAEKMLQKAKLKKMRKSPTLTSHLAKGVAACFPSCSWRQESTNKETTLVPWDLSHFLNRLGIQWPDTYIFHLTSSEGFSMMGLQIPTTWTAPCFVSFSVTQSFARKVLHFINMISRHHNAFQWKTSKGPFSTTVDTSSEVWPRKSSSEPASKSNT